MGILPGIIGTLQATEAIKLILGNGEPLIGRLLLFNALKMKFRELKLRKNPTCPLCGPNRTVTHLIDYQEFCGLGQEHAPSAEENQSWEISPGELKALMDARKSVKIVDVREPHEYDICRIEGSKLIPLSEFVHRISELDSAEELVLHCHHGTRSMKALDLLRSAGFRKIKSLRGGIDAWAEEVDPEMPRY